MPFYNLTMEDLHIWDRVSRWNLWSVSEMSDKCDGGRMFEAQTVRHFGPAGLQLYGIDYMGWASGSYAGVDRAGSEK